MRENGSNPASATTENGLNSRFEPLFFYFRQRLISKETLIKALYRSSNPVHDEFFHINCVKISKRPLILRLSMPGNGFFTLKRAHLSHHFHRAFFCFCIHQQICTCKQHIQLIEIFCDSSISYLCKAKSILDNMECMLYFGTYR